VKIVENKGFLNRKQSREMKGKYSKSKNKKEKTKNVYGQIKQNYIKKNKKR